MSRFLILSYLEQLAGPEKELVSLRCVALCSARHHAVRLVNAILGICVGEELFAINGDPNQVEQHNILTTFA